MSWADPCSNCGKHRADCDCGNWNNQNEIETMNKLDTANFGYLLAQSKWIHSDIKPENKNQILGLYHTGGTIMIYAIVVYTKGFEIDIEDFDGDRDYDYDEKTDIQYLKAGWYEYLEQDGVQYDYMYVERPVVYWQELPTPPKR